MSRGCKGASCHFTVRTSGQVGSNAIVEKIKSVMKKRFLLDQVSSISLNDGPLVILSAPASGQNPSLTATVQVFKSQDYVSINLEGSGPLNTPAVDSSFDFISGADSMGINNNSMDNLKQLLNEELGFEAEKIPVLRRCSDVPVYFSSSDDRMFEYDFDATVFDQTSPFQRVCIYHSPTLGNALFLDDLQNLAEADLAYTHGLMKYGINQYKGKEILILGGGDGGLLHELVKEEPKFVTMVDIDQVVIDACRQHLRGACGSVLDTLKTDKYHVIVGDAIKFMEECISSGRTFDYVFNDLTDIPLSSENSEVGRDLWGFVKRILNLALKCMNKNSIYLNHVRSNFLYLSKISSIFCISGNWRWLCSSTSIL